MIKILKNFLHKILYGKSSIKVSIGKPFSGVYKSIQDVQEINEGYYNREWLETVYHETALQLESFKNVEFIPNATQRSNITNLIPLIISIVSNPKRKISVLDFGGGMGGVYLECMKCLPDIYCDFHVVDTNINNEFGRKLFNGDSRIFFYDIDLPKNIKHVDVVHIGSSLQYILDYRRIIKELTELSPEYIFITDTFMGEMETFATMQKNIKGKGIPYWIFNYKEILQIFYDNNYQLIYKSSNYQPFHDLSSFPPEYNLRDSYNLLFAKNNHQGAKNNSI